VSDIRGDTGEEGVLFKGEGPYQSIEGGYISPIKLSTDNMTMLISFTTTIVRRIDIICIFVL